MVNRSLLKKLTKTQQKIAKYAKRVLTKPPK